jgi:hypothetical protein
MKRLMIRVWGAVFAAGLALGWGAVVQAAEFSADMIHTAGAGQAIQGKVYVKGNRTRNEMQSGPEKTVNIMDMDAKKVWVLLPDQKMYMEMQPTPEMAAAAQKREDVEQMADMKVLGTEKVEGYECEKILYTYRDKGMGVMTQWVAKELNYPIKVLYEGPQGKMTMEYKNIKKGGVPDSAFSLPPDYQKMSMPGMMGGPPSGRPPR